MLILLPPSEGKTAPATGPRLELDGLLGASTLTPARRQVMTALKNLGDGPRAAQVLGLGPRSAREAGTNLTVTTAPCAPAYALYTGVLYEAARLAELAADRPSRELMARSVVILSGLWGAVRATDRLADHRLSMAVRLPGVGRLAPYWRDLLHPLLQDHAARCDGLVVDCRSGAYSPAWQPRPASDLEVLRVRVQTLRADGSRRTVSHQAKHTRGLLAGALVRHLAANPGRSSGPDAQAVAARAAALSGVHDVELSAPDARGRRDLTVVL